MALVRRALEPAQNAEGLGLSASDSQLSRVGLARLLSVNRSLLRLHRCGRDGALCLLRCLLVRPSRQEIGVTSRFVRQTMEWMAPAHGPQ